LTIILIKGLTLINFPYFEDFSLFQFFTVVGKLKEKLTNFLIDFYLLGLSLFKTLKFFIYKTSHYLRVPELTF